MSQDLEFGVERLMQAFKSGIGRIVSQHPERRFVNFRLMMESLGLWMLQQPAGMRTYEELIKDPGLSLMKGCMYDAKDPDMGAAAPVILLQGCGVQLPKAKKASAIASMEQVGAYRAFVLSCIHACMSNSVS